jgi:hypothetical protein
MLIASRETTPGRTHSVAGKNWTFNQTVPGGPMVCDVPDEAAQAVFLDLRNANLFYALDPNVAPLTRAAGPVPTTPLPTDVDLTILDQAVPKIAALLPDLNDAQLTAIEAAEVAGKTRKGLIAAIEDERARRAGPVSNLAAGAALLIDNDLPVLLQLLDKVTDAALRAEVLRQEQQNQARPEVIAALTVA